MSNELRDNVPLWRKLVRQGDLEAMYSAAKANPKNDEKLVAFGLARHAEACIYQAADRHIEELEKRIARLEARLQTTGTWQPIAQSLEYDLITYAIRNGDIPTDYSICRLVQPAAEEGAEEATDENV